MEQRLTTYKRIVAALLTAAVCAGPLAAQEKPLDELYQELLEADETTHDRVANQIVSRWERSGSAGMDLLLRRGQEALDERDAVAAVEHFSALVDHAPDFAEGYQGRALAYFQRDQIGPALSDLQMVLRIDPRHFQALFGLGAIMEGLDRPADALEIYRAIQDIYPRHFETAAAIARVMQMLEGRTL